MWSGPEQSWNVEGARSFIIGIDDVRDRRMGIRFQHVTRMDTEKIIRTFRPDGKRGFWKTIRGNSRIVQNLLANASLMDLLLFAPQTTRDRALPRKS